MAKELVILSWCDVCQDEDTRTEGESYTLGIGNGKLLELELCERHAKPVREVIALLGEHGKPPSDELPMPGRRAHKKREPKATAPTPQLRGTEDHPLPCLLCNETFPTRGIYEGHLARAHNLPLKRGQGLEFLFGTRCPECGEERTSMRALSIHLTREHDMPGHISYAFAHSADPLNVVAETRQRMEELSGTLL